MDKQVPEESPIDDKMILRLTAFTLQLVKGRGWFRGPETQVFNAGKEAQDYVFEAIKKYLENPEKFEPSRGTLEKYLKYNLIKSLVINDLRSSENRTGVASEVTVDYHEEEDSISSYSDLIVPQAEVFLDQEVDFKNILTEIETEVAKEPILENIYLGLRVLGMKPMDVMNEFNISAKDYNNGFRRLTTLLNNIAKKYEIEKPKKYDLKKTP